MKYFSNPNLIISTIVMFMNTKTEHPLCCENNIIKIFF